MLGTCTVLLLLCLRCLFIVVGRIILWPSRLLFSDFFLSVIVSSCPEVLGSDSVFLLFLFRGFCCSAHAHGLVFVSFSDDMLCPSLRVKAIWSFDTCFMYCSEGLLFSLLKWETWLPVLLVVWCERCCLCEASYFHGSIGHIADFFVPRSSVYVCVHFPEVSLLFARVYCDKNGERRPSEVLVFEIRFRRCEYFTRLGSNSVIID